MTGAASVAPLNSDSQVANLLPTKNGLDNRDHLSKRVELTPSRLMMMNAGRSFFHEESTPHVPVEMLQIFVRPEETDLEPQVQFFERPESFKDGQWNLIAGPQGSGAPLLIRNAVSVYDAHPKGGAELVIPQAPGLTQWVYVMDGELMVADQALQKGDAFTSTDGAIPPLRVAADATVVAFLINPNAPVSLAGSHSGYGV